MIAVLRKNLVLLLVMLQLVAPLVHAHIGSNSFSQGLHIPGLEAYRSNHELPVVHNDNADDDAEGLLVVMDAGIKDTPVTFLARDSQSHVLVLVGQIQVSLIPPTDTNFTPQQPLLTPRIFPSAHSPRAPPAQ
jgi:hypothetical protein